MQRIMIIGSGGAGKSTLALQLAGLTGLPLIHLDQHYWLPGWVEPSKAEWAQKINNLVGAESWIIDGNYNRSLDTRMSRADTIIFLDYKRWLCLYRVLKRYLQYAGKTRPDMQPGCPEKIDAPFLWFVWNFKNVQRKVICQKINNLPADKKVLIFKSPKTLKRFQNANNNI